jgi:hypothetical protein
VSSLHSYEANIEYEAVVAKFTSPAAVERSKSDPEFAKYAIFWHMVPVARFGGALGCLSQTFLPLRYGCLGMALLTVVAVFTGVKGN